MKTILTILCLVWPAALSAQTDFSTRNPVGLFEDMKADTVTADLFNHFAPTPDLKFTITSPVPGEAICAQTTTMTALDFDNDGDQDFIMGGPAYEGEPPARLLISNGDGTFTVSATGGLPPRLITAVAGDFDNDGWTDIVGFVMRGGNRFESWEIAEHSDIEPATFHLVYLKNDNGKTLRDLTARVFPADAQGFSGNDLLVADFDQDGWLDFSLVRDPETDQSSRHFFHGAAQGFHFAGYFTIGFEQPLSSCFDVDDDGDIDILVQQGSYFPGGVRPLNWWANDGGSWSPMGTFPLPQRSRQRGVIPADVNNDGLYDLFGCSSDFKGGTNQLYMNGGHGKYTDRGKEAGLWAGYNHTMGPVLGDWNNDTWLDHLQLRVFNEGKYTESALFLNDAGKRFLNITARVNGPLGPGSVGGLALDADLDGDLDIILSHETLWFSKTPLEDTAVKLIRNDSRTGNWLEIQLEGTVSNRSAIGGQARVFLGDGSLLQSVAGGTIWGICQPPLPMHFGLGPAAAADSVVVRWPSGNFEVWPDLVGNQRVVLIEGEGESRSGR